MTSARRRTSSLAPPRTSVTRAIGPLPSHGASPPPMPMDFFNHASAIAVAREEYVDQSLAVRVSTVSSTRAEGGSPTSTGSASSDAEPASHVVARHPAYGRRVADHHQLVGGPRHPDVEPLAGPVARPSSLRHSTTAGRSRPLHRGRGRRRRRRPSRYASSRLVVEVGAARPGSGVGGRWSAARRAAGPTRRRAAGPPGRPRRRAGPPSATSTNRTEGPSRRGCTSGSARADRWTRGSAWCCAGSCAGRPSWARNPFTARFTLWRTG